MDFYIIVMEMQNSTLAHSKPNLEDQMILKWKFWYYIGNVFLHVYNKSRKSSLDMSSGSYELLKFWESKLEDFGTSLCENYLNLSFWYKSNIF
jgi:hypothetical protein